MIEEIRGQAHARTDRDGLYPEFCPRCGIAWLSSDLRRPFRDRKDYWRCSDCGQQWIMMGFRYEGSYVERAESGEDKA